MVKIKQTPLNDSAAEFNIERWLKHHHLEDQDTIRQAISFVQSSGSDLATPTGSSCMLHGLDMAETLIDIEADNETITAAILYPISQFTDLNDEDITEQFGKDITTLLASTGQLNAIHHLRRETHPHLTHHQLDNVRKMLLAMVNDLRVVFLKLADQLAALRTATSLNEIIEKQYAEETMNFYAPLANRLGIGHLKWQLEDLAFRVLQSSTYKQISSSINFKRLQRDAYVKKMLETLNAMVTDANIHNADITGRAKHIYSIHRKMQRKNLPIEEIYDVIATRILVPTVQDCYRILSDVHSRWKHVPQEFDDYISHPKPNGYKSIHTAIYGPDDQVVEIQIRTYDMHEEAELGVSAHWMYKEDTKGGTKKQTGTSSYEAKIASLRQLMSWQEELSDTGTEAHEVYDQIFSDRVYVFTPKGDVIDLAQDATPLDFAYHIHTDVGHRCRGAKINGHIVPLIYSLKTGDRVEIMTTKNGTPSRDWLDVNQGYLTTARARSKVHVWFKAQDYDRHLSDGEQVFEKEIKRLNISAQTHKINLDVLADKCHHNAKQDMFAAIGRGDLRMSTVLQQLSMIIDQNQDQDQTTTPSTRVATHGPERHIRTRGLTPSTDLDIAGVENLLTYFANCCHPIPGDSIIGYITQLKGISVHRDDCNNITRARQEKPERLIEVNWGSDEHAKSFPVDLVIQADDSPHLIKDITQLISNEKLHLIGITSRPNKKDNSMQIYLSVEIPNLAPLSKLMIKLQQFTGIYDVNRKS